MKTKLIIATMLAIFSAQSFATGTLHCFGNATNAQGNNVVVDMFIAVDYDLTSVGGVSVSVDKLSEKYVDISAANAKIVSRKGGYKVTAGTKKNNLSLDYNAKAYRGKAVITIKNEVTISNDIVCESDL